MEMRGAAWRAHRQDHRANSHAGVARLAIGYAVVLGWACHYLFSAMTGELMAQTDTGAFFGAMASDFPVTWVSLAGAGHHLRHHDPRRVPGIEKANKVLACPPSSCCSSSSPSAWPRCRGGGSGYLYLLMPRWEALLNPTHLGVRARQAFFSLSLAGCGTLVYGSYLSETWTWWTRRRTSPSSTPSRASCRDTWWCRRCSRLRVGRVLWAAASVHHAGPGVSGDAFRRRFRGHPVRGRGVRRHHEPHEFVRGT